VSGHRDEHLDLCAAWALGCIDELDRVRLEQHLESGCHTCEEAMAGFASATVTLARASAGPTASRSLRDRVLIAAGSSRPGASDPDADGGRVLPMRISHGPQWIAVAAAAAFAIVAGLQGDAADRLRRELADEREWSAAATAPHARVAEFELTPEGAQALRGHAVYDPASHRATLVFENAVPPHGHDYELWAIRGGKPAALGLIHADERGRAMLRVPDAGEPGSLGAFAVSLEAVGGSPHADAPGGPVVLVGKLRG
jgi:anti-sigma-K factor RskA